MKYKSYLMLVAMALLLAFSMCRKQEEEENEYPSITSFFTIQDATQHDGSMPDPRGSDSESPVITSVSGNSYIVPGGTNIISVSGNDPQGDIKYLLVGVDEASGYFSVNFAGDSIRITLTLSNSIPRDTFIILFSLEDEAGNVSARKTLVVQEAQVQRGKLEISLSWDLLNDIDLHVIQPDSEEIYYGHTMSDEGGYLDLDSNAGCAIDSVNNEHVIYPDTATILTGTYIVKVDFYSDCVGSGVTHYAVSARYNGELINPISGSNPAEGTFEAGTDDHGGAGSGVEVMRFNISGGSKVYAFRFPHRQETSAKSTKSCKSCDRVR